MYMETYPGKCQRSISAAWWAFEELEQLCNDSLSEMATQTNEAITAIEEPFWQPWLISAAVLAAAVAGVALGWGISEISHGRK
jgi:hypothetical protein